jgi:hypothetical protein
VLSSLLKRSPEKTASMVAKLAAEHDGAINRLSQARAAYGAAQLDEAEGLTDGKVVAGLRRELAEIETLVTAKAAALAEAQRRHQQAIAVAERDTKAEQWAEAAVIARKRHSAAMKLVEATEAFATAYQAVIEINEELFKALPHNPDPAAAMTGIPDIERALQLELWRHGAHWAIVWPWGKDEIEPFAVLSDSALAVVESWATPHKH